MPLCCILKGVILLSSTLAFFTFQTDPTLDMGIASLVDFLEKIIFFLNSALSLFDSAKLK